MKSIIEKIYYNSPVFLQNIFISLKGNSLVKQRYGGRYVDFRKLISERNNWSLEEYLEYQLNELKRIVTHAYINVPFYTKLYKESGIDPRCINSIKDLTSLPILDKNELRSNPFLFIDKNISQKSIYHVHTTGTTGTPLKIFTDNLTRQINYAFFDSYLNSLGLDVKKKRVTIGGRVIAHPSEKKIFWRYSFFQKNLLFSSYHLTDENLPYYIGKLKEYRPEMIDSYPSSIYAIAKFMLDNQLHGIYPKGIITSAETLFDYQRKVIEEAFQCKVYDQYGAAEMCVFAGQCKEGNYHYRPDYGIIEILKDNEPVEYGEEGDIVCTGFINSVMPLIRYPIGDIGALSRKKDCPCGENTPILRSIIGRIDDFILTKDGKKVGRLGSVLKGFPIKEAQYIQENRDEIVVKIIKASGYSDKDTSDIKRELKKRIGFTLKINIIFTDRIVRGKGGKLKTVISMLKKTT